MNKTDPIIKEHTGAKWLNGRLGALTRHEVTPLFSQKSSNFPPPVRLQPRSPPLLSQSPFSSRFRAQSPPPPRRGDSPGC
jgi:hypothetical protein